MDQDQKNYQTLLHISRENRHLLGVSRLVEWEKETYMPPGAALVRAEQLEIMASLIHKAQTGKPFLTALSKLIDIDSGKIIAKGMSAAQKVALVEWRRAYLKEAKLPEKFVKTFAKLSAEATQRWAVAKKENDFAGFTPYLEKLIDLVREKAELWGYKEHPYDALLDEYEPYMTTKEVKTLFGSLSPVIIKLIKKIQASKQVESDFLKSKLSVQKQMKVATEITKAVGFDFNHGRIDLSSHPFSMATHPHDSRFTTRVRPDGFMDNLGACLHEFGHSLYEMNQPAEHFGSPLCEYISLGIHESQSRWWETRIGQSKGFWTYFLPKLQKEFKGPWAEVSLDTFYKAINRVDPSFIRVEADEVTYTLHVILRFELECQLVEGSLAVADIPDAWNAKMQEFFGITPKRDSEGCLQDIHWSMGAFGYFPTYSLGNLYASHFFTAFEERYPDWEKRIAKGEFDFICSWLKEEIHTHGKRYTAAELAKQVAHKPLTSEPYTDYLKKKYSSIYNFT